MDVALQQYMYNIEQCTTDFTQTPPSLHNLSSITNLQQQTNPAEAGLLDALFPDLEPLASCTAPLSEQEPACTQEPTASTATRHSAAWAAKNRRAQKRFRERQKVMQRRRSGTESKVCISNPEEPATGRAGTERGNGTTAFSHGRQAQAAKGGQQQNHTAQQHSRESACLQRGRNCRTPRSKYSEAHLCIFRSLSQSMLHLLPEMSNLHSMQLCRTCIECRVCTCAAWYADNAYCMSRLTCNVHLLRLLPFVAQILEVEADDLDAASPLPLSLNQAANPVQADRIIQTYRGIVNLMAGLLLRLDQEGTSDTLLQEMRNATRQSVRPILAPCLCVA